MDTLLMVSAGLDVHKKNVFACVRRTDPASGKVSEEVREFGTMTDQLLEMSDWLAAAGVKDVAMESTGVFWKPVWNILEGRFRLLLANPHELKKVPGRKSDMKDCQWIAHLLACGLLTASFVPDRPLRELRDLTRFRATLVAERTRIVNRIHKVLEDTNIKLTSVASDVLGKSSLAMLEALLEGETDTARMADLAQKRMRAKIPQLQRALQGRMTGHHRFLLGQLLDHIQHLEGQIATLNARIEAALAPFLTEADRTRLDAIPGVSLRTIQNVVAEIGFDMSRFPTSGHLSSWAGLCPANEASAGRVKSRRAKDGNRWLRRTLVESARAAARSKGSYFGAQYRRIAARRGRNRAAMAVAHSLLAVIYHLLVHRDLEFQDLGEHYFDTLHPERLKHSLIQRLKALGYDVTLTPPEQTAA
ncbi:MAG: IS110 family transposase [Planctomycetaceae bacterium]|nr:IS110 family transposase [Planctomycetaceae bacterium]